MEEKRKWRSEEVKEDSRIHLRRNTFNARHLRPHAGVPTTWGMSLRRAVVVSKCNSRLRCGQKKGLATRRQNTTPFNPRFPFATSHTVRTWTREGNIQSSVTEHIFASRANFPTKKQTNKENMKKQKPQSPQSPSSRRKSLISGCVGRGACSEVAREWTTVCTTLACGRLLVHTYFFWRKCTQR